MDFGRILDSLSTDGQLVHLRRLPARPPHHAELDRPLPLAMATVTPPGGWWSHQAHAIDLLRQGTSVAIATDTASGKSLAYQVPILEAALAGGSALVLHPTKALSRDQVRSMGTFEVAVDIAVVDGDTSPDARAHARRRADVVFSNPDMVHMLLSDHDRWGEFWGRLRFVVVDELHVLRGVFGTNVAHLLRRLRRVAEHHGASPTFAFASATIGQPGRLASELCGLDVAEVTDDGSPRAERHVAIWNPPLADERSGRRDTHGEAATIVSGLVEGGHRSIAFVGSRRGAESLAARVRAQADHPDGDTIVSYRGGYLPAERRAIERDLFAGRLQAVVATSALELGIDVGGLDAAVVAGFPGTFSAFWQRAGRAGRGTHPALVVLVAGSDQLDQWLASNPEELFTRAPEPSVVNVANPHVADPHIGCAAHELPLGRDEAMRLWGDTADDAVRRLVEADLVVIRNQRAVWAGRRRPAPDVALRGGSSRQVTIVDAAGDAIGTTDMERAPSQTHTGAVYVHRGQAWRVDRLDLDERAAWVRPDPGTTTTVAHSDVDVEVLDVDCSREADGFAVHLAAIDVTRQVTGYREIDLGTGMVIDDVDLDLPPVTLSTRAIWWDLSDALVERTDIVGAALGGSLHAAEHTTIAMLPLFAICDRWDVGGVSTTLHSATGRPAVFIYDGAPGGSGIADLVHDRVTQLVQASAEVIERCDCATGCPGCVQSPKCGNGNEPLDKAGAVRLLRALGGQASRSSSTRARRST